MPQESDFDLFLDESGNFYENSYDMTQGAAEAAKTRKFPSQLAGLLASHGALTEEIAEGILASCFGRAGWPLPPEVHMEKLVKEAERAGRISAFRREYNLLIQELVKQLQAHDLQPVILANREGVSYGGVLQTYPNMVAELSLRVCRQKQRSGLGRVSLNLICAQVQIQLPAKLQMPKGVYLWRLRECQSMAAVRQGYAPQSAAWRLKSFELKDARTSRALQLCDVLSHSTHDRFGWCRADTKALLKECLRDYYWTMAVRELLEHIGQLLDMRLLGLVLTLLAERFVIGDERKALLDEALKYLSEALDGLAAMQAPVRDSHLSVILSWLDHLITLQRDLALGKKLVGWLRREVELPLRDRLGGCAAELDWFGFALHRWSLTACNHSGDLAEARGELAGIARLLPVMAGRWEHSTLIAEGLIARAVHQTDCFEFAEASAQMESLAESYAHLARAFAGCLPGPPAQEVRSDLRAKALGTWLQSEILDGPARTGRLPLARRLSDAAIAEFSGHDDKERQYQYRCHLETQAGEFASALGWLGRSLCVPPSHDAVAGAIEGLSEDAVQQGFALMHWLRLGSAALLAGADAEADAKQFWDAWERSGLANQGWCTGKCTDYPAHSILRRLASACAARGLYGRALAALAALRELGPMIGGQNVLGAILLAAQAEVAALMWESENETARRLLDSSDDGAPGLKQLLPCFEAGRGERFPALTRLADAFVSGLTEIAAPGGAAGRVPRKTLLALGELVRY
jgi:hypothetical protein